MLKLHLSERIHMHPALKEKINLIYGDNHPTDFRLQALISAIDELLMNLEYEVCINKKLSSHFLNEYTTTNEHLIKSNLRILELAVMNAELEKNGAYTP